MKPYKLLFLFSLISLLAACATDKDDGQTMAVPSSMTTPAQDPGTFVAKTY